MITVRGVIEAVDTAIDTAVGGDGWQASTTVYDRFGRTEGDNLGHKCWTVGTPRTRPQHARRDRMVDTDLAVTQIGVRWSYSIGSLRQGDDYRDALDSEAALTLAVLGAGAATAMHPVLVDARREVRDGGVLFGELLFEVEHRLDLSP